MSRDPASWHDPIVINGFLGWGNRKVGCEAYGPGGRWGGEGNHGDLLGDALVQAGSNEGMPLIVVALDRFTGGPGEETAATELQAEIELLVADWIRKQRETGGSKDGH